MVNYKKRKKKSVKYKKKSSNGGMGSDIRHFRRQIAKYQKSFLISNYIKCKQIKLQLTGEIGRIDTFLKT